MKKLFGTIVPVVLLFCASAGAQSSNQDILKVQELTKNISRVQEIINQKRGIVHGQSEEGGFLTNPEVPESIKIEAKDLRSRTETWGCEMHLKEMPPIEIPFGESTMKVFPFEITYTGNECPIDLLATMTAKATEGATIAMEVNTTLRMKVLDPDKIQHFGFAEAGIDQKFVVKANQDEAGMTMNALVDSIMTIKGGTLGNAKIDMNMSFDFGIIFPMDMKMRGETNYIVNINGKLTKLHSLETMEGFDSSTSSYTVNDVSVSKEEHDQILQGLQVFGFDEEMSEKVGTLSCTIGFVGVSSIPPVQFCDKDEMHILGSIGVSTRYSEKWMVVTLQSPTESPLDVYFLYDEDSNFVRKYGNQQIALNCVAVNTCGGK